MKKLLITILALVAVATARGDEKSEAILSRVATTIATYGGTYHVRFAVTAKGLLYTPGEYVVSGRRYHVEIFDREQFSDGKYRYEVYGAEREVVIDVVDTSASNILADPTRAFEFAPAEFDSRYVGVQKRGREECDVIRLSPRDEGAGEVVLYVGVASKLPVAIVYDPDGEKVDITIEEIGPLNRIDESLFSFDAADYKGYEVIDFRDAPKY